MDAAMIDRAARAAARRPTDAQKEAGNYRKGHCIIHGLNIAIENAKGSTRSGIGKDGEPWRTKVPAHYGYIKGTEGADGDHVDVYIGPHVKSPKVFLVDQVDADSGEFDEHKAMLGFAGKEHALKIYRAGFSDGRGQDRIGNVKSMSIDEFKDWLKTADTTKAVKRAAGGRVHRVNGGGITDWVSEGDLSPHETAAMRVRRSVSRPAAPAAEVHPMNNRPILRDRPDGKIATEESITITHPRLNDGQPTNIPSIWNGQRPPFEFGTPQFEDWAVEQAIKSGQQFAPFNSMEEAIAAAQERSDALGRAEGLADGGAVDDWASVDDWGAPGEPEAPKEPQSFGGHMLSAITDIPSEIYSAGKSALGSITENLNPFSESRKASIEQQSKMPFGESLVENVKDIGRTGRGLVAIPELVASPITGLARSALGHPLSAVTGMDYDKSKEAIDTAMMAMAPARGGIRPPVPAPVPPPRGPLGVTLSEGQATGALPAIQTEQAALRGQLGDKAQTRAQAFADQQRGQLDAAAETVSRDLDPFGARVAETPQEAGALVSDSMRTAAAQRKAGVDFAYEKARALPGELDATAFKTIGDDIKVDLSMRPEPIVIDDKLTPFASRAIRDVEDRVAKMFIQNRADPFGQPAPEDIVGISLRGVDQMRRRLSTFRQDAYASGNAADGRAARAVLDAFDSHIDNAINGGFFRGDPRAVQAWNDARAAHADYKSTFSAGKNDPVGRVVDRILGKGNNPAAIPNDVADFIYGASGVNPGSLNVGVANRVKSILGAQSPEWSAVRQGLFARLSETPPGVKDFGPGKQAQRINRFLNGDGKELAEAVFTAPQRQMIQQYADLMRQIEVPQAGANWSNTGTTVSNLFRKISGKLGMVIGGAIGHALMPGLPWFAGELSGAAVAKGIGAIGNRMEARKIARQMPLVAQAMKRYQKAVGAATRANSPLPPATLGVAAANLSRSLAPLGIRLESLGPMQGGVPVKADEDEQE